MPPVDSLDFSSSSCRARQSSTYPNSHQQAGRVGLYRTSGCREPEETSNIVISRQRGPALLKGGEEERCRRRRRGGHCHRVGSRPHLSTPESTVCNKHHLFLHHKSNYARFGLDIFQLQQSPSRNLHRKRPDVPLLAGNAGEHNVPRAEYDSRH